MKALLFLALCTLLLPGVYARQGGGAPAKSGDIIFDHDDEEGVVVETQTTVVSKDLTQRANYVKLDSFYDPQTDYSSFTGRVSDRDEGGNVFKVQSENLNVKFFRSGDRLDFKIQGRKAEGTCIGYVRSVEDHYFVMYVKDLYPCFEKEAYFRRGNLLDFKTDVLAKRVRDASLYRIILLKRRTDFLRQLNEINHFLWSYDQQRVLTASDYDKRMEEIRKQKQQALESIVSKKKDQIYLQKELMQRLDVLDQDLEFYRIEHTEMALDRWNKDRDLGLPVGERPQDLKAKKAQGE